MQSYPKQTRDFYFFRPLKKDRVTLDAERLYLTGGWSKELEQALELSGVTDVIVNHWDGKDLNFLTQFAHQIRRFWIQDPNVSDITVVNSLTNLTDLYLLTQAEQVEFTQLQKLQECSLSDLRLEDKIECCKALKRLTIVSSKINDLQFLTALKQLAVLDLQDSKLRSLSGLEKATALKEFYLRNVGLNSLASMEEPPQLQLLWLIRLRQLTRIEKLGNFNHLQELNIDGCKKIQDLKEIGKMRSLRKLDISNIGVVPSLTFLTKLEHLETLSFWESTNVADGDLRILQKLPNLREVGFTNRRHYTHTNETLNQFLKG